MDENDGKDLQVKDNLLPGAEAGPAAARSFSQEEVDRIVRERLEREKSQREKAAARAREEAEAEALKKNQEWQALADLNAKKAEELTARVAALEPASAQAGRYRDALEKALEAEKKELPRHVLVLLEKLDPLEQLEYLAANREALGRKPGAAAGVPASPDPRQRTLNDEDLERARRGQASLYNTF